jgi:hypothetical protein
VLRTILMAISGLAFGAALIGDWVTGGACLPATIAAGVVFIGVVFENRRYTRMLNVAPGQGWQATAERFIDPETGKTVTVFYNAATGERRYVAADKMSAGA